MYEIYFSSKLLFGVIDYSTAIINLIIWCTSYFILNILITDFSLKIIIFIIICFPCFLISIIGFNHENIFYVISYILKFLIRKKIYLFKKI